MKVAATLPEPELSGYTPAQVRFAIPAWPMRAAEELRSALVFRAVTHAARRAGVGSKWVRRFASAVRDEVRHSKLCAEVGARLGAPAPAYDAKPVRQRLAHLPDPLHRATTLLLAEVAIGETISTELFKAGRSAAVEPLTRAALHSILRDEVLHSRLGWTAISDLWPALPEPRREALRIEVSRSLGAFERQIAAPALRRLEAREPFDPVCAELGVLPPEVRVEAFYGAVEGLVIPRLNRLGVDGQRAWAERYAA
jgi:hypothetical protein